MDAKAGKSGRKCRTGLGQGHFSRPSSEWRAEGGAEKARKRRREGRRPSSEGRTQREGKRGRRREGGKGRAGAGRGKAKVKRKKAKGRVRIAGGAVGAEAQG